MSLFFTWSSCDFGDTNLDPTRPIEAELKEILPTALTQTIHNLTSIGGRVTGTVVQHYKGIDAQPSSYSQYLIDERTLNSFWRTGLYAGAMKDCSIIIQKAEQADENYYLGIAKILMAVNLGIATSFWGDVPYTEAFNGLAILQPKYDHQQNIYADIQLLLADAIIHLRGNPSDNPPDTDDLIFNGDPEKWVATAKALQARYTLHLIQQDPNAPQLTLDIIQSGAFQLLSDQPTFLFRQTINEAHPLPLFNFERPDQLVLSDELFQLLLQTSDPRLSRMAHVVNNTPFIFQQDNVDLFWGQFDAHQPIISLTELKFIEAESLLRLGEIERAGIVFKEAVKAHMNQINVSTYELEYFIANYIHFGNTPTLDQQLEWLIRQKHLALFAQNPIEAWIDYRRTGYPKLTIPPGANPSFNPSLVIPQRYLYPITERNTNEINWNEAIQRQDGHLLDKPIWAFK